MPPRLETGRLALRLLGPEHLDLVHALFSSDGHTIGDGPVHDRSATAAWLARREQRFHQAGLAWYGLWDRDGVFLGSCGVFTGARCGDEPEIGLRSIGYTFVRTIPAARGPLDHRRSRAPVDR